MQQISCALLVVFCFFALQCAADVGENRRQFVARRNPQQQMFAQRLSEADQSAYPAVGFRPERPFKLPIGQQVQVNNNFNENQQRAQVRQQQQQQQPARLQQLQPLAQQQQFQPAGQGFVYPQQQFQFGAQPQPQPQQQQQPQPQYQFSSAQQPQFQLGPQQFPNTLAEPARLTAEPEEREVVDNNNGDIEVNVENAAEEVPATRTVAAPLPLPQQPQQPPQATVTYFPANAVNFVKPFQAANPGGATFLPYQPNVVAPAQLVAGNAAQLPISAQYYASSAFLPSTVAYNAYTAFPRAAAW